MKKNVITLLFTFFASAIGAQTEEGLWKKIADKPTEDNITALLAENPESVYLPKVEALLWGRCKVNADKEPCRLYIQFFPDGEHEKEASEYFARDAPEDKDVVIIKEAIDLVGDIVDAITDDSGPETRADTTTGQQTSPDIVTSDQSTDDRLDPAPEARTSASFTKIWTRHNVVRNKQKGVEICLNFNIAGYAGKSCQAIVHFLDDKGKPIKDTNQKYVDAKGMVAVSRAFKPVDASVAYNEFVLFMPYSEMHKKGKNKIAFYATLRQGKTVIAKTGRKGFSLTWN